MPRRNISHVFRYVELGLWGKSAATYTRAQIKSNIFMPKIAFGVAGAAAPAPGDEHNAVCKECATPDSL